MTINITFYCKSGVNNLSGAVTILKIKSLPLVIQNANNSQVKIKIYFHYIANQS